MPRQLRIEYPGAIYHVINRGDRREPIFRDKADYRRFLDTLGEACVKTDWQVHAYCLMFNHFHLVLETPDANLVAGMKWFLGTYTGRFNRRHELFGHVFSGRYKALIVDGSGSGYLQTVCDYVHLNPARARLLKPDQLLRDYPWSSWPCYLKRPSQRPPWLRVDRLLGEYGIAKDSVAGRAHLENLIERRRAAEDGRHFQAIRRGWFFGGDTLRQELLEAVHQRSGEHHFASSRRETTEEKARRIVLEEMQRLGWNESELIRRRKGAAQKVEIALRLRTETSITLKWIAQRLSMGTWNNVANCIYNAISNKK